MDRLLRTFGVRDDKGIKCKVFEFERIEMLRERPRRFIIRQLETGEIGQFIDRETFQLSQTGERFVVVSGPRRSAVKARARPD